ncbi:MAG: hypothetical protein ACREDO_01535 [Methyloceanibacter sp.]
MPLGHRMTLASKREYRRAFIQISLHLQDPAVSDETLRDTAAVRAMKNDIGLPASSLRNSINGLFPFAREQNLEDIEKRWIMRFLDVPLVPQP